MSELVAVAAPAGRDGGVIAQILGSAGIACAILDAAALADGIAAARVAAAIVTEEALVDLARSSLSAVLRDQPPWSDIPFVVLTRKGTLAKRSAALIPALGHVTQIERPVHAVTLIRAARAALRARSRQHEAAGYLRERAGAEERLRILAGTLERQVAERTRALIDSNDRLFAEMIQRIDAQDRMNQMQAQLIHVSRVSAMNTMASTLAHELNQPLAAVMNYARGSRRLLAGQVPPASPEIVAALDAAVASAHRAGEIVRHLRELVRTNDHDRVAVDLPALIEDSFAIGMIDAHVLGVTRRVALDPDARRVVADAVQIQQVLINLLRNAIEAMADMARREILITSRRREGGMVEVTVADTGPGLPDSLVPALFSPFKSTKSHGMGIGLSISRTIVEANGGQMSGGNRPEGGAAFCFTLPLATGP